MADLEAGQIAQLKPRIFDVLNASDLSNVSAKKIRLALADMPEGSLPEGLDLTAQKKAIDAVIRDCYNELTQKKPAKSTNKTTTSKKRAKSENDEEPKKKRAPNPNNPLSRPLRLSSEMADVCGGSEMPRYEVVKQLWAYIKDRKLQNESNKRQIVCDEKLSGLFGKPTVDSFEMAKLIGRHLEKIEPTNPSS